MSDEHYIGKDDFMIEQMIRNLPPHLLDIFRLYVSQGLKRRHALFLASSYSWEIPKEGKW